MRKLTGVSGKIVIVLSVILILFQLYTACLGALPDMFQRAIHLFFVLILCFLLKPATKKAPKNKVPVYDWLLAAVSGLACIYVCTQYYVVLWTPQQWVSPLDTFFAYALILIILEVSRRCVGWTFPVMAVIFFLYGRFGQSFPGIWGHKNITMTYMVQYLYHTTGGIWGTMVQLSSTMLAMFGIFGSMLAKTGGSETFIRLGQKLTGKTYGGPAKVTIIASGLFGMISGSAMANVVATGTFTIPMMKKAGYDKEWSAAISAVSSTGGQIMPPIMGAGAFIMSQLIGVSYLEIAICAIIPALLFYLSSFISVHYLAKKVNIIGSKLEESISGKEYIRILVPLGVFLILLIFGYTVVFCAFYATIAGLVTFTALHYLSGGKSVKDTSKYVGNLSLGIATSSAASILDMASLLAGAQISITLISLTGIGVKLSDVIVTLGQGNLFLCLLLSMLVCILLGMGLPTTAAYVLAASVLAPALISLGMDKLVAHLFVFYFSTMATITPPVCAAVFLAAGISQSNWLKTGFLSVLLAIPAFVIPYTFAYDQALILHGANTVATIIAVATAIIGVSFIGVSIAGYVFHSLNAVAKILLFTAGIAMIIPNNILSLAGFGVGGLIIVLNRITAQNNNTLKGAG